MMIQSMTNVCIGSIDRMSWWYSTLGILLFPMDYRILPDIPVGKGRTSSLEEQSQRHTSHSSLFRQPTSPVRLLLKSVVARNEGMTYYRINANTNINTNINTIQ